MTVLKIIVGGQKRIMERDSDKSPARNHDEDLNQR